MTMINTKLYGVTSKGQIKTWRARVYGTPTEQPSDATIEIITQTKIDGKEIVRTEIITKGKNIGKANETTPYEQAVSETESRYRKKFKKGYKEEIPTDLTKADTNALGLPKPMLAHPIHKVQLVEFPAYFQPKLDGHRSIMTRLNGRMMIYSRGGDEITSMEHVLACGDNVTEEDMRIDGELYIHGMKLQDIGSLIKKRQPGSEKVVFHVYDIMLDKPYTQRLDILRTMISADRLLDESITLTPTCIVESMEEAMIHRDEAIEDGYEGGMLRTPDKGYQAGKKSRTLLKLKTFDDSEHTITDVIEGKDRRVNDIVLKVALFICETPDGKRFEVTSMGNMYEKDATWRNREKFIGKSITVQHSGYTKDNIPWHPVALRLREDI